MKKIFSYLMIWRSLPVMLVYKNISNETKDKIDQDMSRLGFLPGVLSVHKLMFSNTIFRRQSFVRIHDESPVKYRLVRWTYKPLACLEISSTTKQIGGGLQIFHGYSTIIFCHSMGKNCSVYQNVTIGRGKKVNDIDVPIIGDNVTIFTGAIIIGGVHIGNNAKIGAGAVVVKDVPENATVVGQAARILKQQGEIHE